MARPDPPHALRGSGWQASTSAGIGTATDGAAARGSSDKEGGTWMVEPPSHVPRQPKLHQ